MSVVLANIVSETGNDWTIDNWHGVAGVARRWRVTSNGVEVQGDLQMRYPADKGQLVAKVHGTFTELFESVSQTSTIPVPVLVAMSCIESAGNPKAARFEAALKDWSFGMCQTLTGTAFAVGRALGFPIEAVAEAKSWQIPSKPIPQGGNEQEWRDFLFEPRNSLLIGAGYLHMNDKRFNMKGDPILLYAGYNAGSPRPSAKDLWGLVNYGVALEAFCRYYNGAVKFLAEAQQR